MLFAMQPQTCPLLQPMTEFQKQQLMTLLPEAVVASLLANSAEAVKKGSHLMTGMQLEHNLDLQAESRNVSSARSQGQDIPEEMASHRNGKMTATAAGQDKGQRCVAICTAPVFFHRPENQAIPVSGAVILSFKTPDVLGTSQILSSPPAMALLRN